LTARPRTTAAAKSWTIDTPTIGPMTTSMTLGGIRILDRRRTLYRRDLERGSEIWKGG
jgi:hypothetical protein